MIALWALALVTHSASAQEAEQTSPEPDDTITAAQSAPAEEPPLIEAAPAEVVTPDYPTLIAEVSQVPARPKAKHWVEVPLTRTSGGRVSQVVECAFEVDVDARGKVSAVRTEDCPAPFEKSGLKAAKYHRFEPWPSRTEPEPVTTLLEFRWVRYP